MGQSSSRNRSPNTSRPAVSTDNRHVSFPEAQTSSSTLRDPPAPTDAQPAKQSRRSRVRQSISNFVKPQSVRARVDSAVNHTRRSWRNSTRFSKPPPDLAVTTDSSSTAGPSTGPSSPMPEKTNEVETHSDLPAAEETQQATNERSSTPFPTTLTGAYSESSSEGFSRVDQEVSQNLGAWMSGQSLPQEQDASTSTPANSSADRPTHPNPIEPPATSLPTTGTTEPALGPTSEPQAAQTSPPPPQRQFPPPGTLVVVQGVVHTTDVPRTNSAATPSEPQSLSVPRPRASSSPRPSTPATTERGNARNRLSALLRPRPSSMASARPPSADVSNSAPSPILGFPSHSDEQPPDHPSGSHQLEESTGSQTSPEITPSTPPQPGENRSGAISSSSIDVLGTLLSVAAAATAASLLTGSSDPILPSGLAPPPNGSNPTAPLSSIPEPLAASRPSSPTPTAGLGAAANDIGAAGRAERMRQAWGSIRERLGLRPTANNNNQPESSSSADSTSGHVPRDPATDTRELMLAEMARAFNLGLGLTNDTSGQLGPNGTPHGENHQREASSSSDSPAPPTLPAEGSFERFLIDLQADLRVTLTQGTTSTGENVDDAFDASSSPDEPTPEHRTTAVTEPSSSTYAHGSQNSNVTETDNIPELQSLSDDSDSEFDDELQHDDHEDYDLDGLIRSEREARRSEQEARGDLPLGAAAPANHQGTLENPNGRINWWRLYRFPAINSPRTQGSGVPSTTTPNMRPSESGATASTSAAPTAAAATTASSSNSEPPPLPFMNESSPEVDIDTSASRGPGPSPPPPPTSSPPPLPAPSESPVSNVVIPVIVVGLQSVNMPWRRESVPPNNGEQQQHDHGDVFAADDLDLPGMGGAEIEGEGDAELGGAGDGEGGSRGRRWGSRAANAIRNLRPGRRQGNAGQQNNVGGPGSRTFLIYVIGGYYPPDHSIVTGGPNNLDSFEALLELAELLGQVKPPTVSKEDIEKSGLETIKSAQLAQYEKDGRIASNCTDRCLICLDDYEPEDEIRVMSCRHAFHMNCVDKWLQTGRNNCPACRSKGVANDGPSSTHAATEEATTS